MAIDASSIPAPEIHDIPEGSLPGAGAPPPFESVGGNPPRHRPRLHPRREVPAGTLYPHPLGLRPVSSEEDIVNRAKHLRMLLKREERLTSRYSNIEMVPGNAPESYRIDRSLHRTVLRINRLITELAATKAPTLRAAALKGDLFIETAALGLKGDEEYALALSLAHDANHLALEASCVENMLDGQLLDLIDKHVAAEALQDRANEVAEKARAVFEPRRPPLPNALYWKLDDALDCGYAKRKMSNGNFRLYYDIPNVAKLRMLPAPMRRHEEREPAPWGNSDEIVRTIRTPDERRAARVAEIIAAADDLMARTEALADEVGLTEANRIADDTAAIANQYEDAIMAIVPSSPTGWLAKASWLASRKWTEEYLGELALQMITDMASLSAGQQVEFGDAPLPAAPDRSTLESYRTFLHFELRELNLELDGRPTAAGYVVDNPAGDFHFAGQPKPSARAAAVLGMFGLLPRQEEETPAAQVAA